MHHLKLRPLTAVALAMAAAILASTQAASAQPGAAAPSAAVGAQARSDVPADPAARYGVLPNGMRYVLLHNATPPGVTALRLRVDAGSLNEADNQRGIAHFIEHLTLNETTHVPEGEMIRILERAGLSFGPDTNATTEFEQTVYMLDLPRSDASTVDTALMLMREVAGEATLRQPVIEGERGVILSEERTRAAPQLRLAQDELSFLFRGDPLGERLPIGLTDVISTAPRERFAEFYNGYYRPERTTLIAVGDFDPAEMEAKIRGRFSDWRGRGTAAPSLPPLRPRAAGSDVRIFQEEGLPTRLSLSWVAPRDPRPDTAATRAEETRRSLGMAIINRRFERLASGTNPPFIIGVALHNRLADRAEVSQLITASQPGGWERALQTLEQEQRRAVQFGFTQAELDREINDARTRLTAQVSGAATRASPALAMGIVDAVNGDRVFTSPQTQLELFNRAVTGLTAAQVSAAFRTSFASGAPLVHVATPQPIQNAEAAVRSALAASRRVAVAAPAADQARMWPYTNFGAPGQVAERRELPAVGATAVRFANGVRLTVKRTQFTDDEVLVSVRFGNGLLGLPTDRASPVWALQVGGFTSGGLGQLSYEDMQQVLSGKVYSVDAGVAEDAFTLSGRTRTEDVATQMQVLAAYIRDPAWRPAAYDRIRSFSGTISDQLETTPQGVFGRDAMALLHGGDQRWATPSREMMASTPVTALSGLIGPALANGQVEVVIVGDITVDEAIRQTAATFGALPPRPAATTPAGPPVRFPAGGAVTLHHRGRADQALGLIAWPTAGYYENERRTRALDLLTQVFQLRLLDEIRERQGTAYSPNASHDASEVIAGYGYMGGLVQAPPAALDAFFRAAADIARALREQPIPADELDRARRPQLEAMQRNRNSSNRWWLNNLGGVQDRPERIASIGAGVEETRALTAAELQQVARQYLTDGAAWRLSILPQATATPAAAQ